LGKKQLGKRTYIRTWGAIKEKNCLRLLKLGKSIRIQSGQFKKKLISGFDQPTVRANQQLIESSWLINYATTDIQTTNEIELYQFF
jgi:hypothetical protein